MIYVVAPPVALRELWEKPERHGDPCPFCWEAVGLQTGACGNCD